MTRQVVILAGGLATRLGSLVEKIPKSLINVNGTPFIIHQLNYLKSQGLKDVHLCLGHMKEQIIDLLKQNNNLGINFSFSYDGDYPLGTGGALLNALSYLDENFFLQYGDTFLPINYTDVSNFFYQNNNYNILTVFKNENEYDKSNIILNEDKIVKYEKELNDKNMKYIDYGLSILKKVSLNNYDSHRFTDLSSIYQSLIEKKIMISFEVSHRFYEIGKPSGIKETEKFLSFVNNKI